MSEINTFENKTIRMLIPDFQNKGIFLTSETNEFFLNNFIGENCFFLTDDIVYGYWKQVFPGKSPVKIISSGENSKNMQIVEEIMNWLLVNGADRTSCLVGIGGGVICDITGFVASIYMRGIDTVLVPTSLLAQIDASIGGKNGVNIGAFKNIAGTFRKPSRIIVNPLFLNTLPLKELQNGFSEAIKHACIADAEYFKFIEDNLSKGLNVKIEFLTKLIYRSIKIKTQIVDKDPYEKNLRKLLNFGHTFGHLIEKRERIPHGQSVSIGMCISNSIAHLKGYLSKEIIERISKLLEKAGLQTDFSEIDLTDYLHALQNDKKKEYQHIHFIMLRDIGEGFIQKIRVEELEELFRQSRLK